MKNFLRKFLNYENRKGFADAVGSGTLLRSGFKIDIRSGQRKKRVFIGSNCVLYCSITLECQTGKVTIGNDTFIGASQLICAQEIVIGSNVLIAWGCTIVDHNSHSIRWSERREDVRLWHEGLLSGYNAAATTKNWEIVPMSPVHIADKSWIGFNSIILKGINIGEGAVVGAGAVVTKDVPAWTVVAGNPAHIIREIPEDER